MGRRKGVSSTDKRITKADFDNNEMLQKCRDAWLDIQVKETELFNPLLDIPIYCAERPELYILWLMQQPEYFSFVCNHILGIDILPQQAVILETIWKHKFPMLIASRGMGKCERDSILETESGFVNINDLCSGLLPMQRYNTYNLKLRGENGFNPVEYKWSNGYGPTIKIKTDSGFEKECTPEHPIRLIRNGNICWVQAKDIKLGDFVPIVINGEWFPITNNLSDNEAYTIGYLHKENRLPSVILSASKSAVFAFLMGYINSHGKPMRIQENVPCIFINDDKEVIKWIQFLLTKFGIIGIAEESTLEIIQLPDLLELCSQYSVNSDIFSKFIYIPDLFINKHKGIKYQYIYQVITDIETGFNETFDVHIPNDHSFISGGFISHNTFLMAIYSLLRMLLLPGRKIVLCGSVFRQSKFIFNYMEKIAKNSVLSSILGREYMKRDPDKWQFFVGDSVCSALPIGDGQNIRGERANDIITDEFATHNPDTFETVIAGFGSVSADPIGNVKLRAAQEMAANLGIELEEEKLGVSKSVDNQIVITGTAYYDFNHFSEYWKKWHDFICCKNDGVKIKGQNDKYKDINPDDYAIIRIPYELIPKGVMDESMVARSKATVTTGIYEMEFGACFSKDSQGFFKRTLIEKCVTSPKKLFNYDNESFTHFSAGIRGNPQSRYIMGIDPASERSRFAVVVLELRPNHRRVVYCWTTKRSEHIEKAKQNSGLSLNFYSFCARKIRDIMQTFPIERIALDAGGGGITIMEALHDKSIMHPNEQLIWPVIDYDKKMTPADGYDGLHIIDLIQFSDMKWIAEANHGLKYDLEHQMLLFPYVDSIELANAIVDDASSNRTYDTLEDCVLEIEEIKNELSTIVVIATPTGKERWDTPDVKISAGVSVQKGKMDKDRYSALLLANSSARKIQALTPDTRVAIGGGQAEIQKKDSHSGAGFISAPDWYKKGMSRFNHFG